MNGTDLPLDATVIPAGQKLEIVTAGTGTVNALAANPATGIAANYPLKTSITVDLGLNSASALTLLDVVEHYNSGAKNKQVSPSMKAELNLDDDEKLALVDFLHSLTSPNMDTVLPNLPQ